MTEVWLGEVAVGDAHPTVFVAEFSTFFNQDLELARTYIRAAVEAGVDVVKSEILHNPEVCLPTGDLHAYDHAGGRHVETYRELIERKVLPLDSYRELSALCDELGVPFVASVYDVVGVDFLVDVAAAGVKFARDSIDNFPLIRHAARSGLPLIFDAGVAFFAEVAAAVDVARRAGAAGIIVNHHPGANPAPPAQHNMRVMQRYRDAFDIPVGLACHHAGEELLYLAVGMGANLVEKGVDIDPTRVEQDVVSATSFADLPAVLAKLRACWEALGRRDAEPDGARDLSTRRGLVARRSLEVGERVSLDTVDFAFPPHGVSVRHWDLVEGAAINKPLGRHQVIRWDDLNMSSGG